MGLEGQVELEATGCPNGLVEHVETLAGNPILARAATEALKQWKFKPFTEDGKNITVSASVSFNFKR
jgi:TonB family protein